MPSSYASVTAPGASASQTHPHLKLQTCPHQEQTGVCPQRQRQRQSDVCPVLFKQAAGCRICCNYNSGVCPFLCRFAQACARFVSLRVLHLVPTRHNPVESYKIWSVATRNKGPPWSLLGVEVSPHAIFYLEEEKNKKQQRKTWFACGICWYDEAEVVLQAFSCCEEKCSQPGSVSVPQFSCVEPQFHGSGLIATAQRVLV